jgi:hypothetical protein
MDQHSPLIETARVQAKLSSKNQTKTAVLKTVMIGGP